MGTLTEKNAVIFSGGDFLTEDLKYCEKIIDINNSYIICADKGYEYAVNCGIKPHIVVGDFDSTSKPTGDFDTEIYPVQKDDTDTMIAIKSAIEKGYTKIAILGALGGRFDHSIANIQSLVYIADNNASGYIVDSHHIITVLGDNATVDINKFDGYLSLFAITNTVQNLNIRGCEYNLDNYTLENNFPLGVSNRIVDDIANISIDKGKLLVIQYS